MRLNYSKGGTFGRHSRTKTKAIRLGEGAPDLNPIVPQSVDMPTASLPNTIAMPNGGEMAEKLSGTEFATH